MASRDHWLLLRESLLSLYRAWEVLPRVCIVSDGSWTAGELEEAFDFWPSPIETVSREQVLTRLIESKEHTLAELAKSHPLALKLGAIVISATKGRILFVDSDILWFSDPAKVLAPLAKERGAFVTSEPGTSFNLDLLRTYCPELLRPPGINSGCVWLDGPLCDPTLFQELLSFAARQPTHEFNEQTIIAIAAKKYGGILPPQFCLVDFADAFSTQRRNMRAEGIHARHYVRFMRHQFYRDALTLR